MRLARAWQVGRDLQLEYAYDMQLPGIQNQTLVGYAHDLAIDDFEFYRTHWAIDICNDAFQ